MTGYEKGPSGKKICLVCGNQEGFHRGHRNMFAAALKYAKDHGLETAAAAVCSGGKEMYTEEEKALLAKEAGMSSFHAIRPGEPVGGLLERLGVEVIFALPEQRKEPVILEGEKRGIPVIWAEPAVWEGEEITADRVKKAFEEKDFPLLEQLCGHAWFMKGRVVHGKALGRTVGMPTANLETDSTKKLPQNGVYATGVRIGEERFHAMTNIGKRPSVDNFDYVTVEAFILDFSRDIYDQDIIIEIKAFVRDVKKFADLDEVRKQVDKDIRSVRAIMGEGSGI